MKIGEDFLYSFLIFVISTLLLLNLYSPGIYYSHDGPVHIARLAQFSKALGEKQIPVRWLDNWNFGLGYPAFVYVYSLPYYIGASLTIFNLDFQTIFKLLMYLSLVGSGFTFYFFAKKISSKPAALVGAIFYIAAPYRFADIFERGALGEAIALIFIPLLFLVPSNLIKNPKGNFMLGTIITFLLITTHALTFMIFLPVAAIYSIFLFKKNIKNYILLSATVFFGFLLSSFQWMPMIFEQKYVDLEKTYFGLFERHLITINQLLRIPKAGINIGTAIQLGTAQIVIVIMALTILIRNFLKKKKLAPIPMFFLTITVLAAFLTTNLSKPIWEFIKPLQTLLFPWRFLTLTTFSCAILTCFIVGSIKNKIFLGILSTGLIFLAIFPSRHYLKPKHLGDFNNQYYYYFQDPEKLDNYFLPKGLVANLDKLQLPKASIIKGDGQVSGFIKQNTEIKLQANLNTDSKIQFHTIYFPGWKFSLDGKDSPVITNYPGLEGLIIADVPKGVHSLSLEFKETPLRKMANLLSLMGVVLLIFISFSAYNFRKK